MQDLAMPSQDDAVASARNSASPEQLRMMRGNYANIARQFQQQDAGNMTQFLRAMNVTCMTEPTLKRHPERC